MANANDNERMFTSMEAAKRLDVSRSTMLRWIESGLLRSFRTVGKHRRISESDLREMAGKLGIRYIADPDAAINPPGGVLAIDDDRMFLDLLELMFRRNFPLQPFHGTTDAFAAGALVLRHRPAVLLLDLRMPGINGIAVCKTVRAMPELDGLHIAAVTAHAGDPQLTDDFLAAGGERIFGKPIDQVEFREYLADIFSRLTPPESAPA